ncbi:MAG: serine/threonine protein phosphatase, partial [Proteobacteria bacterium]|nr:serine/threonine protein phosphatase [Pseudomonadota bacterium]
MLGGLKSLWRKLQGEKPRLPEGHRVYAIGDIHGRLDLLDALHAIIAEDAAKAADRSRTPVYLGSYINRGIGS